MADNHALESSERGMHNAKAKALEEAELMPKALIRGELDKMKAAKEGSGVRKTPTKQKPTNTVQHTKG